MSSHLFENASWLPGFRENCDFLFVKNKSRDVVRLAFDPARIALKSNYLHKAAHLVYLMILVFASPWKTPGFAVALSSPAMQSCNADQNWQRKTSTTEHRIEAAYSSMVDWKRSGAISQNSRLQLMLWPLISFSSLLHFFLIHHQIYLEKKAWINLRNNAISIFICRMQVLLTWT